MTPQEVAIQIKRQMFAGAKRTNIVWSWRAYAFRHGSDATMNDQGWQFPFLCFRVKGRHFSGRVFVYLRDGDCYCVAFKNLKDEEVLPRIEECYDSNFVELIDEVIEKMPEYKF